MTWTRLHTGTVALLALAFLAITALKHGPRLMDSAYSDTTATTATRGEAQTFWNHYRQATRHRTAGRMDSAETTYRTALNQRPTHHDALYYLGHALYDQNELRAAREAWQRLLDINPKSARAHTQIGEVHFCFPDHAVFALDRARTAYQHALDLHNEETRPLLRLSTIALLENDRPTVRKHLKEVRGFNRNNSDAAFLAGYLAWHNDESARATVLLSKAKSRTNAENESDRPACPLAERITAPLRETDPRSSESSPYARLDSLLRQVRTEHLP